MTKLFRSPRRLARRLRLAVEILATLAFVAEALLERFGDPGLNFAA